MHSTEDPTTNALLAGQPTLPGLAPWELCGPRREDAGLDAGRPAYAPQRSVVIPVECAVGCQGTMACFCGQGELSDDPLWVERDGDPL